MGEVYAFSSEQQAATRYDISPRIVGFCWFSILLLQSYKFFDETNNSIQGDSLPV